MNHHWALIGIDEKDPEDHPAIMKCAKCGLQAWGNTPQNALKHAHQIDPLSTCEEQSNTRNEILLKRLLRGTL